MILRKLLRSIPRLWKYSGVIVFSLTLLMMGAMYGVRALDLPGCVVFFAASGNRYLYDLTSGRDFQLSDAYFQVISSPDGYSYAYTEVKEREYARTSTLILNTWDAESQAYTTHILQTDVIGVGGASWVLWSKDNRQLAYIWAGDESITTGLEGFLTVVNTDGTNKRTVKYSPRDNSEPGRPSVSFILGWSADGEYLAIDEGFAGSGRRISLWSITTLHPSYPEAGSDGIFRGEWSSQGHQYGAIISPIGEQPQFMIFSPEKGEVTTAITLPEGRFDQIIWSPDGKYVTLASRTSQNAVEYWNYAIFDATSGQLLYESLEGDRRTNDQNGFPMIRATWTADSREWVYLRERSSGDNPITDLIALDIKTGLQRVIAPNLVNEYLNVIFQVSISQRILNSRGDAIYTPDGNRMLLPYWHQEKIRVDLADFDGENRINLVENADEILFSPTINFAQLAFWSFQATGLMIPWAIGSGDNRQAYISRVNMDGTDFRLIDTGYPNVVNVELSGEWLGFVGKREDVGSMEIVHLQTGERHLLATGLGRREEHWNLLYEPEHDIAMVVITNTDVNTFGRLFMKVLNGGGARELDADGAMSPIPSNAKGPIYLRKTGKDRYVIESLTWDGTPLRSIPFEMRMGAQPRIGQYSDCRAT